jgi:GT2 family glycosyltransferase
MQRPAVDVVVPFAGSAAELAALVARLERLELGAGDAVTVADNRPAPTAAVAAGRRVRVVAAGGEPSPGFARNRGAEAGAAEWLVFLDADTLAPPDLAARYFDPPPGERTAVLAGGVSPLAPGPRERSLAARYAHARGMVAQERALSLGRWAFAQTANCAVRRAAFEQVGGFREGIRAGEDADLCYRLRAAGWELERRDAATATHLPRRSVPALLSQLAVHGAAAAWLEREHPGSFPAPSRLGLARHSARRAAAGAAALARGDRDEAIAGLLDPLATWVHELGRLRANRPRGWPQRLSSRR